MLVLCVVCIRFLGFVFCNFVWNVDMLCKSEKILYLDTFCLCMLGHGLLPCV